MNSTTIPAGRYYIGDPCYAISNDDWMQCLEDTLFFGLYKNREDMNAPGHKYAPNGEQFGAFKHKGFTVAGSSTAHGDGQYSSNIHFSFPVDAGLLGAIPEQLVSKETRKNIIENQLGVFVDFERDVEIGYEPEEGTVIIGHIEIVTDPDETEYCWYCGESTDWCVDGECQEVEEEVW